MANFWKIFFDKGELPPAIMKKIKNLSHCYILVNEEKYDQVNRILWQKYSNNYYLSFTDYFYDNEKKELDRDIWFAIPEPLDEETKILLKLL